LHFFAALWYDYQFLLFWFFNRYGLGNRTETTIMKNPFVDKFGKAALSWGTFDPVANIFS